MTILIYMTESHALVKESSRRVRNLKKSQFSPKYKLVSRVDESSYVRLAVSLAVSMESAVIWVATRSG
jgi:hypothetical protein